MAEGHSDFSHPSNSEDMEHESGICIDRVPEDILFNILSRLEDDPRHLALVACVCRRLFAVIMNSCWKSRCLKLLPTLIPELLQSARKPVNELGEPPGGWSSLQKLLVCCPGLWHAGVLPVICDVSVDQEMKSAMEHKPGETSQKSKVKISSPALLNKSKDVEVTHNHIIPPCKQVVFDNIDVANETAENAVDGSILTDVPNNQLGCHIFPPSPDLVSKKMEKKRRLGQEGPHLSLGLSTLSREQGTKLLASRFRADILYICDWSACVHKMQGRQYKLFRGVFKDFKGTHVWRNLNELKARKMNVCCAFCSSASTWDMVTSFCLRRSFDYHDDGEPVVRAYVCEHGHVAGAWTDRPTHKF